MGLTKVFKAVVAFFATANTPVGAAEMVMVEFGS